MSNKNVTNRPVLPYIQATPSTNTKMDQLFMQQEYGGYIPKNLDSTPLPGVSTPMPFTSFDVDRTSATAPKGSSLQDILNIASNAGDMSGGGQAYTDADYIGSNRYDYFVPGRDNEDAAAQQQSWYNVMFNGLTKGVVLTGTTFL